MKIALFILFALVATAGKAQLKNLNLQNALVVGQLDKSEDRYSVEINLTELLISSGIKALPSLNVMKLGSDGSILERDSMQQLVAKKGYDTYVLVSVRGYDKKFKVSTPVDFKTAINAGNLFPLYRAEITNVSFEFSFYRNGQYVASDIIRCGNVSSRDTVIKRFRKKVAKHIVKKWK